MADVLRYFICTEKSTPFPSLRDIGTCNVYCEIGAQQRVRTHMGLSWTVPTVTGLLFPNISEGTWKEIHITSKSFNGSGVQPAQICTGNYSLLARTPPLTAHQQGRVGQIRDSRDGSPQIPAKQATAHGLRARLVILSAMLTGSSKGKEPSVDSRPSVDLGSINPRLEDFEVLDTLGIGTFSRVRLCKQKSNGKYFAVKVLKKSEIIRLRQVEHVMNEKRVMNGLNHP
eukprot:670103-Rhodomonas_salina.1